MQANQGFIVNHLERVILLVLLAAAVVGCETSESQSTPDRVRSEARSSELLTDNSDIEGPTCIEKMQEVDRELEPFRASAGLPAFETPTDQIVAMSDVDGARLLDVAGENSSTRHLYIELVDDGRVRFQGDEQTVAITDIRSEFRELRSREQTKARLGGQEEGLAFWPVLVIERDVEHDTLAAVLTQVVAIDPTVTVGFVYAMSGEGGAVDVLPPLTLQVKGEISAHHRSVIESLRDSDEGAEDLEAQTKKLHRDVYGEPWDTACHQTWLRIQRDGEPGEGDDGIGPDEKQCCSEANWDAIKFLAVPSDHRRSYARWHIVSATLRGQMSGPLGKALDNQPTIAVSHTDGYADFLRKVANAEDGPHRLEVEK